MSRKAISITLEEENLLWLRGQARAGGRRSVSQLVDRLVSDARAAGRVLSREQLLDALKGAAYETFDRSIDVHISKLRGKLEADPKAPRLIKTVRGAGYVLGRDAD